jgi:hypothetical protein
MRLSFCGAAVIVIHLELALGIEPRVSALRVRRFGLLSEASDLLQARSNHPLAPADRIELLSAP